MADVETGAAPGDLTVSFLFGWEFVAGALLLLVVLVVAVSVVGATRASRSGRTEWQAWLDARSGRTYGSAPDRGDGSAGSAS